MITLQKGVFKIKCQTCGEVKTAATEFNSSYPFAEVIRIGINVSSEGRFTCEECIKDELARRNQEAKSND